MYVTQHVHVWGQVTLDVTFVSRCGYAYMYMPAHYVQCTGTTHTLSCITLTCTMNYYTYVSYMCSIQCMYFSRLVLCTCILFQ